jgi:hypothetical protein
MPSTTGALEAVDRILNRGGDADDVLRAVVSELHERAGYAWAGILFVEGGTLALGPEAGVPDAGRGSGSPSSPSTEPPRRTPPSSTGSPCSSPRTASSAGTPAARPGSPEHDVDASHSRAERRRSTVPLRARDPSNRVPRKHRS